MFVYVRDDAGRDVIPRFRLVNKHFLTPRIVSCVEFGATECYDLVHFGQANQWRQAKQLGDNLVVGVHSDKDIEEQKGPVIMGQVERCRMIRAMKWVYEVDASIEDITRTNDGTDTYADAKSADRFRACDRMPGMSTAALIQRILRSEEPGEESEEGTASNPSKSSFLPCTRMIAQFASRQDPKPNDVVDYVADVFEPPSS